MPQILHTLGRYGPKVPALAYGAMGLTTFYGDRVGREESKAIVKLAVELGCTFIDTCDFYGPPMGENERLLGEIIEEESAKSPSYRSKLFLCTKFGSYWDPPNFDPGDHVRILQRSDPAYVRQQCEASLKNLGVDYIDLYYQNRMVKDAETSVEDTWKTVVELQKEGKIKYLGLSEADEEYIRRVSKVAKIDALQIEFSPFAPNIKTNGILAACRELGISIVCYSPLGRGLLTGKIDANTTFEPGDLRGILDRYQGVALKDNLKFVDTLKEVAAKKNCTPGQLCLAWVIAQGDDFIALSGTKKENYLRENVGALDVTLTEDDIKELDEIVNNFKAVGDRYPPGGNAF